MVSNSCYEPSLHQAIKQLSNNRKTSSSSRKARLRVIYGYVCMCTEDHRPTRKEKQTNKQKSIFFPTLCVHIVSRVTSIKST